MQARCPHCRNVFPTERTGVQFCPHCGREVDVPNVAPTPVEPAVGPPPGPPPSAGPPGAPPPPEAETIAWERRAELGWARAFWMTWKESMFSPVTFWQGVRPAGPAVDALVYAWILYAIAQVLSIPLALLQTSGAMVSWAEQAGQQNPELRELFSSMGHQGPLLAVGVILGAIVLFPVFLVIGTAILHLLALLFGAGKNGYWATFRVVAYAFSPYVFAFFSCLAPLAAIYVLVLTGMGLVRVQETTQGKAVAVVLTPFGLGCFCCCLSVVLTGVGLASLAPTVHP